MSNKNPTFTKQKPTVPKKTHVANETVFKFSKKPNAAEVYLVGEFNNWDQRSHRMMKKKGEFVRTLQLKPGDYQYKFLVDGEWHVDPSAHKQVPNAFGTTNSVVRVEETSD